MLKTFFFPIILCTLIGVLNFTIKSLSFRLKNTSWVDRMLSYYESFAPESFKRAQGWTLMAGRRKEDEGPGGERRARAPKPNLPVCRLSLVQLALCACTPHSEGGRSLSCSPSTLLLTYAGVQSINQLINIWWTCVFTLWPRKGSFVHQSHRPGPWAWELSHFSPEREWIVPEKIKINTGLTKVYKT